ncbi:hypothetical protein D3C71_1693200 [compost metagenome]
MAAVNNPFDISSRDAAAFLRHGDTCGELYYIDGLTAICRIFLYDVDRLGARSEADFLHGIFGDQTDFFGQQRTEENLHAA